MAKQVGNTPKRSGPSRRGKPVSTIIAAGTFTGHAPFIESAIEIAEIGHENFPHLLEPAKNLMSLLWRGLDRDALAVSEQEVHDGLMHFSQVGLSRSTLDFIPKTSGFWSYLSRNTELVFELCARVQRWKSLKGPAVGERTKLLRFMLMNPAIPNQNGVPAFVHSGITLAGPNNKTTVAPLTSSEEILRQFKQKTGTKAGSHQLIANPPYQLIGDVRHHKIRDRQYRGSLEKRTKKLGINC